MAIEKMMTPNEVELMGPDIDVEVMSDDTTELAMDDGSIVIEFGGAALETDAEAAMNDHDANLAEYVEDAMLESLASELVEDFENDRASRKEWATSYINGLDLLGMKVEDRAQPWQGASGVYHPMLTEAVVRFQAQAMSELMPAAGPVKSKIIGKMTPEKFEQSKRVQTELNYLITEEMPDYRNEMEQMLFKLPLAGSAFKKIYYDPILERPVSVFVPAEDFVASYGASNLRTCPRYTHVMKKTFEEIRALQVAGFYADIDLPEPTRDITDIEEKYNEMDGTDPVFSDDPRHTLLEMHVDIILPEPFDDPDGLALPFVITMDKTSRTILAVRRNWYEDDQKKRKRSHFVHYPYLPGMGFYGTGLIHTIGGLAKSATSIMRQLIDAGTLSNLPAGLKSRGMRIKGDNTPLMPGEFRDVDVPGGAIKDSITFLPYKEPSQVLYTLLNNVVEEGRRIGSVGDMQVGDMNAQAPVGTTLALMERSMKVMSGVQARLHAAMKEELRILARIVHDYMPSEYAYEMDEPADRVEDFDGRVDVVPVSDPNAATMAQRIMQYQAALQLSQQAPQLYDLGKLHRQMLEVLGIPDAEDIIKLPEDIKPADPVSENMSILKQEPVKAFSYQDHEAHIMTHMAAMQDPKIQQIVGQSPFAAAIQSAMQSHITEHVALQYRKEIEAQLGTELPDQDEPLPESVERELSKVVAQAAGQLLKKDIAEVTAEENAKQQADPLTQIQQRELTIKEQELQHKMKMDQAKLKLDMETKRANIGVQEDRLEAENIKGSANIALKVAELQAQEEQADIRSAMDITKEITDRME
jgi:hypothetical protein|tara:strand:+ start:1168 stop:3600 length:2433 start_codon:yes stop_codon:yes gene_type:complete